MRCPESPHTSESKGTVVAVDGADVLVKLAPRGCGRCHEPGGCGGQSLTQMMSSAKVFRVSNAIGAREGDAVVLLLDTGVVRQAAWLAYGLPLALCLIGAVLGQILAGDALAAIGALLGLLVAWLTLWKQARKMTGNSVTSPQLNIRFDHSS